jgi:hypothetical protein
MAQGKKLNCRIVSNEVEYEITTKHPIYRLRYTIMTRCYNASSKDYKFYQGKGIKVCDEWKDDFIAFFKWCIDNGWKVGLKLDRIDNTKDYEPANCRFITTEENLKKMHIENDMHGEKASNAKLTNDQVLKIRELLALRIPAAVIARDYKVCASTIGAIKRGQNWKKFKV